MGLAVYLIYIHYSVLNIVLWLKKNNDKNMGVRYGFIFQGSICVITASESSVDTIWFVMVTSEEGTSNMKVKNYYGFIIQPRELFFKKETRKKEIC